MRVSLRKTSLVDYPGRIAAVLFFSGCNLRCPWCQNRDLVLGGMDGMIPLDEALAYLAKRRNILGGVVLSGGEPCVRTELPLIISRIKELGLGVKLDTNGVLPEVLEGLFAQEETRPGYIAMDLKLAPRRYSELLPPEFSSGDAGENIIKSAALIRSSGIPHEFRSLRLPSPFFTDEDKKALAPLAAGSPWNFRPFRTGSCLDPAWDKFAETP